MKTRAITGFFFVIVMLASVLINGYVFSGFFLLLSLACLAEFYGLIKQTGAKPLIVIGILTGLLIFTFVTLRNYPSLNQDNRSSTYSTLVPQSVFTGMGLLIIIAVPVMFITELFKKSAAPFLNVAYSVLGLFFVLVPFLFFHELGFRDGAYNFHLPLGFMLMLWANDTGAYLSGRAFGKHKLFERHSPKKTWEGFIGGVIISAGVGLLLSHYYTELAWKHWVAIALIISCFGTLGDLVESMFKRSINVKDSGGILPGHGGLLDRFDGLLMAAPLVWAYLMLIA